MTAWDILDSIIKTLPPLAATSLLVAVVVILIVGFSKYGFNFLKYGFKQNDVSSSLNERFDDLAAKQSASDVVWGKRFDDLDAKFDNFRSEVKAEIDGLRAEVKADIDGLRSEVKSEINDLRSEVKADIDGLRSEVKSDISDLRSEFKTEMGLITVNHFGHLKEFLTELTSILLDKNIINNQDKARLDNHLRGM